MGKSETTHYKITVVGELDPAWSDWLEELTVTADSCTPPRTELWGSLDQTALRGVLNRIWDLNLTLVSVMPLHDGPPTDEMGGSRDE